MDDGYYGKNSEPPVLKSHPNKKSNQEPFELINSQGHRKSTIVYSSILEDAACRPREERVLCLQSGRDHPIHRDNVLYGVYVTEYIELYNACVQHNCREGSDVFRDKLVKAGVNLNKMVHITMVLINDCRLYADNSAWLYVLIERELDINCPRL